MSLSNFAAALILFLFPLPATPLPVDLIAGSWHGHTNALPNPRLPHVPLSGNGAIGLLLDARNDTHAVIGPGGDNAVDLYVGSTSLWSCGACTNALAPGCCRIVPLGGLTLSLAPSFPAASAPLTFSAAQRIVDGRLLANFTSAAGGVASVLCAVHPVLRAFVANISWAPGPGDPADLRLAISVWALPAGPAPGEPKPYKPAGTLPLPMSAGCLPGPCAAGPAPVAGTAIAASRQASGVANGTAVTHPIWGALAVGLYGLPPTALGNFSTLAAGGALQATVELQLPAGVVLSALVGEAETQSNGTDPSGDAAELVRAVGGGAGGGGAAVGSAADAFWGEFWARSFVSLPGQPALERVWHGAQYGLAATASTDPNVPGPALFGVWATSDEVGWNGDNTLE